MIASAAAWDRRAMLTFMFATGIENIVPTINNGRHRVDELEKCGFYKHWRTDFDLVQDMGIRYLRYGPPIHTTWLGDGRYDWSFCDETFADLKRRDIVPIVDLCHFGVPDWVGDFQNPDFPALFDQASAARAARETRVPIPVVRVLVACSITVAAVIGYAEAAGRRWNAVAIGLLALLTLSFALILDLDRPSSGRVRVNQQPLVWALEDIRAQEKAAAAPPQAPSVARP